MVIGSLTCAPITISEQNQQKDLLGTELLYEHKEPLDFGKVLSLARSKVFIFKTKHKSEGVKTYMILMNDTKMYEFSDETRSRVKGEARHLKYVDDARLDSGEIKSNPTSSFSTWKQRRRNFPFEGREEDQKFCIKGLFRERRRGKIGSLRLNF